MKKVITLSIAICLCITANAQNTNAYATAKKEAAAMANAIMNKDYAAYVKWAFPSTVEGNGRSYEKLAKETEAAIKAMEAGGQTIISINAGRPQQIVDTAGELQCTVPQKMVLTNNDPKGTLTTTTTLVGYSPDKGKTWYFMDAGGRNINTLRKAFPRLSSKLNVAAATQPVFTPAK